VVSVFGANLDYASLFGFSASGSNSFLNTLYNPTATTNSPAGALNALQSAETNETKDVAVEAQQTTVARNIANFTTAVQGATSVQSLLSNPTVLTVILTANDLTSQIPYTALARKALMSDPTDSSSLANTLTDTNWASAATAYNFYSNGLTDIQKPATIASITNAYAETMWRLSLDTTTPGLSSALDFRANASSITSVDQILGNSVMRDVVTTVLGLPLQIAEQPLSQQESDISSRVNLSDFQKSPYVDKMIQQYLILKATNAATTATPLSTIASLTA